MDEQAVIASFLQRYAQDQESGRCSSVAEYQALYPGFEEVIAREWSELAAPPRDEPATETSVVAHYRLIRELARGGQGEVHLAEDTRLRRRVALKLLRGWGEHSNRLLRRFQREAAVASRLDHPGICTVYDSGLAEGVAYIAMRFVEGESLRARIAAERSAAPTTKNARDAIHAKSRLIEHAARALHAAHEAGIVHRDVKPGNVMVAPTGEPVLLDFGLALDVHDEDDAITRSGELFGTPAYMSPEQLVQSPRALDRRTDVWSLGVTLYELLTLERPFDAATRDGLYHAIRTQEPRDARALQPAISKDLSTVIATALAKDADRRYQTALAFADDLRRAREGEPIAARPVSAIGRLVRWARRRPAAAALAVACAIGVPVVAGLLGMLVAQRPEVAAQRERAIHEQIERHLAEGFAQAFGGSKSQARAEFEAALRLRPLTIEAIFGLALVDYQSDAAAALRRLDTRPPALAAEPVLLALKAEILDGIGRKEEAARLLSSVPEPTTALELFLAGMRAESKGHAGDKSWFPIARDFFEKAVLVSPAPRLMLHHTLAHSLFHTQDEALARRVAHSLQLLWPQSSRAWAGAATAIRDLDPDTAIAWLHKAIELGGGEYSVYADLGFALNAKKKPEEAIPVFRHAIDLRSDSVNAHFGLAHALCELKKWTEGESEAALAVELSSRTHAGSHILLGNARTNLGRPKEAIEPFERALLLDPDEVDVHWMLAMALRLSGQIDRALEIAREGATKHPDAPNGIHELGCVLREAGKFEEAATVMRRSIELRSDSALYHQNLGAVLLQLDHDADARDSFRKCIELDGSCGDAHNGLAIALYYTGEIEKSVEEFREARRLGIDPGNLANNRLNLGKALIQLGRFEEALEPCRELTQLAPEYAEGHYGLGQALKNLGKLEEALVPAVRACELDQSRAEFHLFRGYLLEKTGKREEALAAVDRAIEIDGNLAMARWNRGIYLRDLAKLAEADKEMERASELDPKRVDYLGERVKLKFRMGDLDAGIALIERALAIDANNADLHCSRGLVLTWQGLREEALVEFELASRLNPAFVEARFNVGQMNVSLGRYDRALDAFRDCRWPDPPPPGAPPIDAKVREAERGLELARGLDEFLRDPARHSPAERAEFARAADRDGRRFVAAQLYADAFAADPRLLEDADEHYGFEAACCAIAERSLPEAERTSWRQRALSWLRADFDLLRASFDARETPSLVIHGRLLFWRASRTLTPLRDPALVAALSPDESAGWRELWSDVDSLAGEVHE